MELKSYLKRGQKILTRPIGILLALSIALYPFIEGQKLKYLLIGVFAGVILKIVFEIEVELSRMEKELKAEHTDILEKISSVAKIVETPFPPQWKNFTEAQKEIMRSIENMIGREGHLTLDLLGVSARYSWRMVEDEMGRLIKNYTDKPIEINVIVTDSDLLKRWGLVSWSSDLERTIIGISDFRNTYKAEIESGRVKIKRFNYDTIPQWHGVMINRSLLFLGAGRWSFDTDTGYKLQLGQCPYKKFEVNDRFGGSERTDEFNEWVDRFKYRSGELEDLL